MKRFKLFLATAAIITGMASCNTDETPEPVQAAQNYSELSVEDIQIMSDDMDGESMPAINVNPIIPEGAVIVFLTEEGRFGKMQILDYDFGDNHKMTFKYVTYENDGSGDIYSANPSATVRGTWLYDLDEGLETSEGADFWWERHNANESSFTPKNGADFTKVFFNN